MPAAFSTTAPGKHGQDNLWISAVGIDRRGRAWLDRQPLDRTVAQRERGPAIPWNPAGQTVSDMSALFSKRTLFLAASGSAYFWAIGMLSQVNIYLFASNSLFVETQRDVSFLLGTLDDRHRRRGGVGRLLVARQDRTGTRAVRRGRHCDHLDASGHRARRRRGTAGRGRLLLDLLLAADARHDRRTLRHSAPVVSAGSQPARIARFDHGGLQFPGLRQHVGGLRRVLAADQSDDVGTFGANRSS